MFDLSRSTIRRRTGRVAVGSCRVRRTVDKSQGNRLASGAATNGDRRAAICRLEMTRRLRRRRYRPFEQRSIVRQQITDYYQQSRRYFGQTCRYS